MKISVSKNMQSRVVKVICMTLSSDQDRAVCPDLFSPDLRTFPWPDVLLVSRDGAEVTAHSALLAAGSPLLRTVLNSLEQDQDNMIRIVFSELEQVHLSQLVQYLYTGAVDLGPRDKTEVSAALSSLLVHRTLPAREEIKEEVEDQSFETLLDHSEEYLDLGDMSGFSKLEPNLEELDMKPCRVVLANLKSRKMRRKSEEDAGDEDWKPRSGVLLDHGSDSGEDEAKRPVARNKDCDLCDFSSLRFPDLASHVKSSHPEHLEEFQVKHNLKLECRFCEEKFKTQLRLTKHVEREHPDHSEEFRQSLSLEFACRVCGERFAKSVMRREHEKAVHRLNKLEKLRQEMICPVCGHQAPHRKAFSRHRLLWHKEGESPCKDCGQLFGTRWDLKVHLKEAHQRKNVRLNANNQPKQEVQQEEGEEFYCEFCGKGFSNQKQYKCHVKYHHQMDHQLKCKYCDFRGSKHSIERHEALHFDPTLPCETCGKMFHHMTNLRRHQRMSHLPDNMKKHRCHICSKGFDEKIKLHEHFNVHTGAKPYKCRVCEMAYQNKSNRTAHERKAHGITFKKNAIGKVGTDIKLDTENTSAALSRDSSL